MKKNKATKWVLAGILVLVILYALFSTVKMYSKTGTSSSMASIDQAFQSTPETSSERYTYDSKGTNAETGVSPSAGDKTTPEASLTPTKRKVISTAEVHLEVKDYAKTESQIQKMVNEMNGYIVLSNSSGTQGENMQGDIQIRLPQEKFQTFLSKAEGLDVQIKNKKISGTDVTEEYVDLASRLKSKRVIEERLLSFMEKAGHTEELLRISSDLGNVQGEIEQILGRMTYLDNQTDFATVHLFLSEEKIIVPVIEQKELNTWEKTKQQFNESVNSILFVASSIFIFFVGKSPLILTVFIIGTLVYFIIRKKHKKKEEEN